LPRLVDLGGSDGSERELPVAHQDTPEYGHEHDPEDSRDDERRGGDEVVIPGEKRGPDRGDEECGQRENGTRGDVAPIEPMVRAAFSSRSVPRRALITAMPMTAVV